MPRLRSTEFFSRKGGLCLNSPQQTILNGERGPIAVYLNPAHNQTYIFPDCGNIANAISL